jgi:hypothetical protein
MPRKKVIKDDKDTSKKKLSRPSGNGLEDIHPRLQPNFFRTQVMVYDTSIEPAQNKIEYMLAKTVKDLLMTVTILGLLCYAN